MENIKLFEGHDGHMLTFEEYKQHANTKVISYSTLCHVCRTFLFNKNYKKAGKRILPPKNSLSGQTKEDALKNAYNGYIAIYKFLNN